MSLAGLCLLTLVVVIVISCVTNSNVGLLALVCAWIIAVYAGQAFGFSMKTAEFLRLFPIELFLTLLGVTLLFAGAQANGTLAQVSDRVLHAHVANPHVVSAMLFLLAFVLSALGAGNIAATALLATSAMHAGRRIGISPFVVTLMIGHGSIAGTLSPLTPMGGIVKTALERQLIVGQERHVFLVNLVVNVIAAVVGYIAARGWRPWVSPDVESSPAELAATASSPPQHAWTVRTWGTLAVLAVLPVGVLWQRWELGLCGLAGASVLVLLRLAKERDMLRDVPWNVLLMVCGMSTLVELCEEVESVKLFGTWIAQWSTTSTVTGVLAGVSGLVSMFSSTSGVVLPAFLPLSTEVVKQLGAPDRALAAATAVVVGGNIVDISAVSTVGALCLAATKGERARQQLFRQTLAWGITMTLIAALLCNVFC